jgi:Tup N-terminal
MSYMGGGHRPPMPVGGPSARLEELLDQIRLAFESVSQDVEHSKSQHNDYERRGTCLIWTISYL